MKPCIYTSSKQIICASSDFFTVCMYEGYVLRCDTASLGKFQRNISAFKTLITRYPVKQCPIPEQGSLL